MSISVVAKEEKESDHIMFCSNVRFVVLSEDDGVALARSRCNESKELN